MRHDDYRDLTIADLERAHELIGVWLLGEYRPAVTFSDLGYQIRVRAWVPMPNGGVCETVDYLRTDHNGIVWDVPLGCAEAYRPGRIPVDELVEAVTRYAHPGSAR